MSNAHKFEIVLLLLMGAVVLDLAARRMKIPSAALLLLGGAVWALAPGTPQIEFDPDLVMVLFLPPLLLSSAYFTAWGEFKADLRIILQLAVGAVGLTTLIVGLVTHWIRPDLPWAACFALGAIVSPPDAVAAKAVLERVALPRRIVVLLEGESLVNDASGLVLFRMAVATTLTGSFSLVEASGSFVYVALFGVATGLACGWLSWRLARSFGDARVVVVWTFLSAWTAYLAAEAIGASGVLSTVACGILMGRTQHEILSARTRIQAQATWSVIVFMLEMLVFVLMGLAVRGVVERFGSDWGAIYALVPASAAVFLAMVVSRFLWIFPTTYIPRALSSSLRTRDPFPPAAVPFVMSWAGVRGVVSLAAALSLPEGFPGRDFIIVVTFVAIGVSVVLLGSTLGPLAGLLVGRQFSLSGRSVMSEAQVRAAIAEAQFRAIQAHSKGADGIHRHPRLVDQYEHRLNAAARHVEDGELHGEKRRAHFLAVFAASSAGRAELLRLFRDGRVNESVMHHIEGELDLEELSARNAIDGAPSH